MLALDFNTLFLPTCAFLGLIYIFFTHTCCFFPPGPNHSSSNLLGDPGDHLAEAPSSLLEQPDSLIRRDDEGLLLSPDFGDVPELDLLPDALDLPNVAQDMSYDLGGLGAASLSQMASGKLEAKMSKFEPFTRVSQKLEN